MYFLIYCSEDGDVSVDQYQKEELERAVREDYSRLGYFSEIKESDPQYWKNKALIIKGEIVVPKAVEVIKKYELRLRLIQRRINDYDI